MTNDLPSVGTEDARRVSLFTVYADAELRDSDDNVLAIFPAHRMEEARRVVACWNACVGVETQLLAQHPAPFSELRAERDELASRVRELEGALWGCIAAIERTHHCTEADRLASADAARAALSTTPESKP